MNRKQIKKLENEMLEKQSLAPAPLLPRQSMADFLKMTKERYMSSPKEVISSKKVEEEVVEANVVETKGDKPLYLRGRF